MVIAKELAHISVPKIGSKVKVMFSGGNVYSPEYVSLQDVNVEMSKEISDSYQDAHVILYDKDQQLKILYKVNLGIQIWFKESNITINPDQSITIEHAQTQSIIELQGGTIHITANSSIFLDSNTKIEATSTTSTFNGTSVTNLGPSPTYSAILAEPLWTFLKMLAAAVDAKLPTTPGAMTSQAEAFEAISVSKNVKVSP